ERNRAVVVVRRRVAPGAVGVVDQRAAAGRDGQTGGGQSSAVNIGRIGQQLGLGDQPRAAVLGDRRQRHQARGRRVVDRGDVEAGRTGRGEVAVGHGVGERNRAVVVVRRRVAPGAVGVVDQRAAAGRDGQTGGG